MPRHRAFNADRFLDKFEGREKLLKDFVAIWRDRISLPIDTLTVKSFKLWLVRGQDDGKDEGKDDLLESLYQVYDLCNPRGHEHLLAACTDAEIDPDPDAELPVECLCIKLRTHHKRVFQLAYDRHNFVQADRFSIYQGEKGQRIPKLKSATKALKDRLSREFKKSKNSERVIVRSYVEGGRVNVIVYHEKRVRATLVMKGTPQNPRVRPHIYRPAQQDFISYDQETGRVEIESGLASEENKLRLCFAEECLKKADFFEGLEAADRIDLGAVAEDDFKLRCPDDVSARVVQLRFKLDQSQMPQFTIRSKDVLRTLALNGLHAKLQPDDVEGIVIKIFFPGDRRGKRVELSGTNSIKFNRATHTEEVFSLLTEWGLLYGSEVDEDAIESRPAKATFAGSAARSTS